MNTMTYSIKVIAISLWALSLTIARSGTSWAGPIDFDYHLKKNPNSEHVVLEKTVDIFYFKDSRSGRLKAKSKHKVSLLALKPGAAALSYINIPFSSFETVNIKSARYYLLDSLGNKKLKENVKVRFLKEQDYYIEGIFYSDLKVKQFKPRLPIRKKSLLVYQYEIIYNDLKFLNRFYAQEGKEATQRFQLTLHVPSFVESDIVPFNTRATSRKTATKDGHTLSYELSDLPAIPSDLGPVPANYYLPHFVVLTKSYNNGKQSVDILKSTRDLYGWYHQLMKTLRPDAAFVRELSGKITESTDTDRQKVQKIYQWVQNNIAYVAFEDGIAGFRPAEAHQVIRTGYGDCKGMANLLVNLLRAENINAYPTWIGTRILPYNYSLPSLVVDNHMICTVELAGKYYFLDGTDPAAIWDTPPSHIQGKNALVGKGEDYELVDIPVSKAKANKAMVNAEVFVSKGEESIIKGSLTFSGLHKNTYVNSIEHSPLGRRERLLSRICERYLPGIRTNSGNVRHEIKNGLLFLYFEGSIVGRQMEDGMKVYLLGGLHPTFPKHDHAMRMKVPMYFRFNELISYTINYHLPPGASIESVPEGTDVQHLEGTLGLRADYRKKDNTILYESETWVEQLLLSSDEHPTWKTFVKEKENFEAKPIIFNL